ncbi:hypothetical protein [Ktedonosporobacter rubrisoli]|nr:hypothetical protein [Ktedonosporobacter rubrisoli]
MQPRFRRKEMPVAGSDAGHSILLREEWREATGENALLTRSRYRLASPG